MKQREEKQRKFHETLLNILYHQHPNSPSSSSPSLQEDVLEAESPSSLPFEKSTTNLLDGFDDLEEKEKSSSSSESNECGNNSGKLTRAQRKNFRKKKLKEASSRRQNIIGPLLPSTANCSSSIIEVVHQDELQEPQSTSNVIEESNRSNVGNLNQESEPASVQNKLKHRRTAKRCKQQLVVDALCQVHSSCSNANEEMADNRAIGNEET